MAGQYGLKETKEALDLGFALVAATKSALEDGKVNLLDAAELFKIIPAVGPAVDGLPLIAKELGELDAQDSAELLAYAAAGLATAVTDPGLALKVNAALKLAVTLGEAYAVFRA